MSSSELAISVARLSKIYRIYDRPQDRLRHSLSRFFRRRRASALIGHDFAALNDVSFEVLRGETIGIIGRNGSGKSTLLQIICGTLFPTSGEVRKVGRIGAILELGAGFNPEFSGRENVYLNATLLGLTRSEIDERLASIIEFADIDAFIDQPVKTYSSGMWVRLAFSVVAHIDADILVIDEALAVGDVFFMQKCMRFLRAFQQRGTILFVSHDTAAVVNLCQRVVWLEGGSVREVGPAKLVCEHYLASTYGHQHMPASSETEVFDAPKPSSKPAGPIKQDCVDMRATWINQTCLRNDLRVFEFAGAARSFGDGGVTIRDIRLMDASGSDQLSWVVGGERVLIRIDLCAHVALSSIIVGFFVKDRLGQVLFGDNTYLVYADKPFRVAVGERITADFGFRMPILPQGSYAIDVAVADGNADDHVQHQWIHDALVIESHANSVSTGLVGIPFEVISLRRVTEE